jgi:chromosome segregation protein
LYLSKLEIFGFKSFAEKTSIEFDSGVSAIVGPNGSGKSNIVDALRWVLGEQGDKALRSEKRDDVVFSGTRNRKPLSLAEVSLTIINNKNILPTEYSEVQIARRFYRSGETEYYLNGTKVRLKDIKNLFIDTGIGPDAYSVIELKMVETILSHVKNERRKLFEEAAGIVSYKKNRDLTFNKLESVHEALLRVNDIIREKQRNVNALERQVKRNEEAKIVSEELRELEIALNNYDFNALLQEIENIKSSEKENIDTKETLTVEIKEFDTESDALRDEIKVFEMKISEMSRNLTAKKDEINKYERENLVSEQRVKSITENVSRLTRETESLKVSINHNRDKEEDLRQKVAVLRNTVIISENSLAEKKARVDESIEVISTKKNELAELGKKIKDINKLLNDRKSKYQANKIKLENNLTQLEKISQNNAINLFNITQLESEKSALEKEYAALYASLKKAESELNDAIEQKNKLSESISKVEKEITAKTIALQNKKTKTDYLRNIMETLEDYAEGIRFLVKEKEEKGIATVIDSIEVEDKFRVAIETALGEVSNYLIVDDSRDANRLINMLINNKKGKISFILNDKLPTANPYVEMYFGEPEFIGDKGVYGFADQFIKCKDQKYFMLMKYILDEYVIVENIDIAIKLSKDNYYKFITLDGDIVTESFIRAGSEVKKETIKIGREEQIKLLEEEAELINSELGKEKDKLKLLTEESSGIDLNKLKEETERLRISCSKAEGEISKLEFKVEEVNRNIASSEKNYEEIEKENESLNKVINALIKEVSDTETDHANLDKELAFLTEEFNQIEQQYSDHYKDYNSFNLEVIKVKNELRNEEQNYNRVINNINYQESQIVKNNSSIGEENRLLEDLKARIEENNEALSALREEEKKISTDYNTEKAVFDEKKELLNEIDLGQRDRRLKFDKVSQALINAQIRIKENEIKSTQIKDYIYKKYEVEIPYAAHPVLSGEAGGTGMDNGISEADITEPAGVMDEDFDADSARKRVEDLSERLKRLGGGYQQLLFDDFQNEKDELQKLIAQKEDLLESEKDIRKTIEKINKEARERFLQTFEKIRENFIMIFNQLFQEGDEANLRLVYDVDDEGKINEDPLESKIEIVAKPRGKRPTSIELLSGGEKTLTAIALLFAIYLVKPSPFCVLDEVDAPLDVANLGRFNNMIRRFADRTQFILITHNERTMETVDRLYGVTMQEPGVTTIVETRFKN